MRRPSLFVVVASSLLLSHEERRGTAVAWIVVDHSQQRRISSKAAAAATPPCILRQRMDDDIVRRIQCNNRCYSMSLSSVPTRTTSAADITTTASTTFEDDTATAAAAATTTTTTTTTSTTSTAINDESSSTPSSSSATTAEKTKDRATPDAGTTEPDVIIPDDKECVKLFGRLADKYILLDASAGQCCYSACTDCEYRLPGGGYRMSDQRSTRPKWIPIYTKRQGANNVEHQSKWSATLFNDKTDNKRLSHDEFHVRIRDMPYEPPLGGPSVAASLAQDVLDTTIDRLWNLLIGSCKNKDVLTEFAMSRRLEELAVASSDAGGTTEPPQGITWKQFVALLQDL